MIYEKDNKPKQTNAITNGKGLKIEASITQNKLNQTLLNFVIYKSKEYSAFHNKLSMLARKKYTMNELMGGLYALHTLTLPSVPLQ